MQDRHDGDRAAWTGSGLPNARSPGDRRDRGSAASTLEPVSVAASVRVNVASRLGQLLDLSRIIVVDASNGVAERFLINPQVAVITVWQVLADAAHCHEQSPMAWNDMKQGEAADLISIRSKERLTLRVGRINDGRFRRRPINLVVQRLSWQRSTSADIVRPAASSNPAIVRSSVKDMATEL